MKINGSSLPSQLAISVLSAGAAMADFNPIPLTPESYNADIIVEKTAPAPLAAGIATTASMDGGTANTGFTWYETGFNAASPSSGLPAEGTTFSSESDFSKSYTMPPSYTGNCAVFLSNLVTTGSLTLDVPAVFTDLSVLSASGGGAATIDYTVTYIDNSTESGSLISGDWFGGADVAWTANGRTNAASGAFDSVDSSNPRLYSQDLALTSFLAVKRIDFSYVSGGRCSIFALSGGTGGVWTPLEVTGYNHDLVFGATEVSNAPLTEATTVSMDGGTANTGNTWYESGYYPAAPSTGLPAPGSTITSIALPDHHYLMPSDYTAPNAIYVDAIDTTATITFANPLNYSALSFLNATANGAVTVQCTMHYQDGSSEVQTFTAKDWFNGTPYAYNSAGRVNLDNRSLNNVSGTNPRLYEAEFVLSNNSSPITSVDMEWIGGGGNSRVAVLAVSATAGALKPIIESGPLPVNVYEGSAAEFTTTISGGADPKTYRWQKGVNGTFTDLSDGGPISGATTLTLTINPVGSTNEGEYRLVATNAAGSTTTLPAALTVVSSLTDVTAPGDFITAFGGDSPAGEAVDFAIDDTTQKYLNFGSGPNATAAPFVGPVGFVVTPQAGPTVLGGIRLYTANDTEGRDPVDFKLEGSNDDGTSWTTIASGSLSLPVERNAAGAGLDPLNQFINQILFPNTESYTSYQVTFETVKDAGGVNSMQIAEVELLGAGSTVPAGSLTISRAPDGVVKIVPSRAGTLQTSTTLTGPNPATVWSDLGPVAPDTPYEFFPDPNEPKRFFRLQ